MTRDGEGLLRRFSTYLSSLHVSPVAPSRYAKSWERIGLSSSQEPWRNASMNCSFSSVNTLMSSIEPPEIECIQRDHNRVVVVDQRHHGVLVALSPLVASVEGAELLLALSGRREGAHQEVAVLVDDRRAVTDHADAGAAEHRQSSLAKDAVELRTAARHDIGGNRVLKDEPDEVEARQRPDDAALVQRLAVRAESREVDPREMVVEAGAPDEVRHVEDATVVQHGHSVAHAGDPCDALDSGGCEVLRLHPDQRRRARGELRADLAPDRRPLRQHAVAEKPEHRKCEPRREA